MSCCPGDSKALSVLLGFQREIRAFVSPSDQNNLSSVSWWLYHSARRSQSTRRSRSWPTDDELNALAQRLHTRLARSGRTDVRRRRTKMKLSGGQLRVLLRDLLLVASGLRPSCLVDCCALTKELAQLLLDYLDEEIYEGSLVRAVLLDGNVFFVNVDAFVCHKMATGLEQQMYMDVSACLTRPKLITNTSENEAARIQAFAEWTVTACRDLLDPSSRVLEWKRPTTLNATALAGILLCYPCVYDIYEDHDVAVDEWSEQENCLDMCPLLLLQTMVIVPQQQLELTLHKFSVPQHLLDNFKKDNEEEAGRVIDSPYVKLLQTQCRLQLQQAIERSCFGAFSIEPQVRVGSRTLARVAL